MGWRGQGLQIPGMSEIEPTLSKVEHYSKFLFVINEMVRVITNVIHRFMQIGKSLRICNWRRGGRKLQVAMFYN